MLGWVMVTVFTVTVIGTASVQQPFAALALAQRLCVPAVVMVRGFAKVVAVPVAVVCHQITPPSPPAAVSVTVLQCAELFSGLVMVTGSGTALMVAVTANLVADVQPAAFIAAAWKVWVPTAKLGVVQLPDATGLGLIGEPPVAASYQLIWFPVAVAEIVAVPAPQIVAFTGVVGTVGTALMVMAMLPSGPQQPCVDRALAKYVCVPSAVMDGMVVVVVLTPPEVVPCQ